MRILVVSDIHANWTALRALKDKWDVCLCIGDLVDYGVEPAPCIEWVKREAKHTVRGNHDHGSAHNVSVIGGRGFRYLTGVTRPITRQLISPEDRLYLGRLPMTRVVTLDETRFFLVHATPQDPLDEYAPVDPGFWSRRLADVEADIVCVGHTHQPFALEAGNRLVVNPGSVGLPRDGDPRGSYAIIENRKVELKRFEYPVEEAVQAVMKSGLGEQPKEMMVQSYRNGGRFK
ncbi:MAG: metallophosphoesterase [Gemmataceae bacterium]